MAEEETEEIKPYTDEDIERIRSEKWDGYHDPLCGKNLKDGSCDCKVRIILRFIATIDALKVEFATTRGPKECPWCKGPLQVYHSGVMCPSCMHYFEKGVWVHVACDEAHAHGKKCLIEVEPPEK
jgi:hypothetical protein